MPTFVCAAVHVRRFRRLLATAVLTVATGAMACPALLDRTFPRLQDEKPQSLCQYQGKVLLVVNTASLCGYTPQYRSLEALHRKYRDRGLVVLGFPSNDFGSQEPGNNQAIAAFCEGTFGVQFPMFGKSRVSGAPGAGLNPLFADLSARTAQAPRWNFQKYLVGRDAQTVRAFGSDVDPTDAAVVRQIEELLKAR
jgi:glutathione peroxidase